MFAVFTNVRKLFCYKFHSKYLVGHSLNKSKTRKIVPSKKLKFEIIRKKTYKTNSRFSKFNVLFKKLCDL